MKANRFCVEFFSTLANPLRLRILQSLLEKEKTVSQLVSDVAEERTLVSHNLARLLQNNLIGFKRAGKERTYYANPQLMAPLFYLLENFVCTGCSFRKTCKILQKRHIAAQPIPIHRESCPGCVRK